ncbi:hypothetical protein CSOJ01_05337 [Colletotrichum sojae]|uniref:NACHT domain-containing protein n=1 Tax=Colletotrichum sojae TaxID=2175907 RepID=A0A8H6MXP1_9PEZI|nr:hypothetical protein CSOJ01_05337 [Colletotrichum sojae]
MDPASAFGLAASIVQTLTFASDLISKGRQLYHSAQRSLVENEELEAITRTLQSHSRRIAIQSTDAPMGRDEIGQDLSKLCDGVRDLCKQLIATIESLKKPDSATRWDSFRQALQSVWKEQDIADLAQRLERYRRQIDSIVLAGLKDQLEMLVRDSRSRDERLEQTLSKIMTSLKPGSEWQAELLRTAQRSMNANTVDNTTYLDLVSASLSEGAKKEREKLMQRRTLESLRFADMRDRYERIPEAHQKTFEWIFRGASHSAHDDEEQPWTSFNEWLSSDKSLYWVTGKPGAGKSTLMKFLSDNHRLLSRLEAWKASYCIYTGSFFFWNSGTSMQMSKNGLLQSLLHQTVSQFPQEIPKLFPDRWGYQGLFGYDSRPWTWSELSRAFTEMVSDENKSFFFLIDGLDEFDGDCGELTNYLLGVLSQRSNVKVCVTSRPWLVFEDAFKLKPSLRVEDLTKSDIRLFASEKLAENPMFAQLQNFDENSASALVEEVSQKASGVFLWVSLVVKSLLDGLRDGDTVANLQSRLLELPAGLGALFRKLLGDLEPSYFEQAARIFQTVRASHLPSKSIDVGEYKDIQLRHGGGDARSPLRLLSLSFINEDPLEALSDTTTGAMNAEEQAYRAEVMRRQLQSRCKGLLEAPDFNKSGSETKVEYLHRTVKDFLEEDGSSELMTTNLGDFDVHIVLCASLIRHAKAIRPDENNMTGMETLSDLLREFLTQCHWLERLGRGDYVPYLEEMDKTALAILGGPADDEPPPYSSDTEWVFSFPHWTRRVDPYVGRKAARVWCLFDYTVVRSLTQYVKRKLADGYNTALKTWLTFWVLGL